jgi:hypothetical protein
MLYVGLLLIISYDLGLRLSVTDSTQGRHFLRGGKSEYRKLFYLDDDKDLMFSLHEDGTYVAFYLFLIYIVLVHGNITLLR